MFVIDSYIEEEYKKPTGGGDLIVSNKNTNTKDNLLSSIRYKY